MDPKDQVNGASEVDPTQEGQQLNEQAKESTVATGDESSGDGDDDDDE